MSFEKHLSEALKAVPMARLDKRLDSPSDMRVITSDTEHAPPLDRPVTNPAQVYVNLQRHTPVTNEEMELPLDEPVEGDDMGIPEPDLDITDDDLPQPDQKEEIPATPSGNEYTLDMAKGQLDGIIEKWMDLSGNYPEGEQRHKFIEIGERLREISGVIHRDFLAKPGAV